MNFLTYLVYRVFLFVVFLLLLPALLIIALFILVTSGYPFMYAQWRTGKSGKPFRLYKFRTMVKGADELKQRYQKLNEAAGPVFKIFHDPRFTPVGKFLSHTGLDELPQIFNILKGEMAIIGPRPLPLAEVKKLKPWQLKRHQVKPGIISPWIVNGYHSQQFDAWMKSDLDYSKKKNIYNDTLLLLKAIRVFVRLLIHELLK